MTESVNVLALVRGEHRFVFMYDDRSLERLLLTFSQYADDPELEFTWDDAAELTHRVKLLMQEHSDSDETGGYSRAG